MNKETRLFGTDGIRGLANQYPMTPEISLMIGKALGQILLEGSKSKRLKVVVGKDTRLSGYIFEQSISSGIASMGLDVFLVGPLPTPAIAFLTLSMRADAGVVISASHNTFEDNGFKLFDSKGFKLSDQKEIKIERLVFGNKIKKLGAKPSELGKAFRIDDAPGRYVVFVKSIFPKDLNLEGIKIVLDCANGAAYRVSPIAFQELGAEVFTIGTSPDGKNINTDCGSLYPELIRDKVVEIGADIGIALDGDADRVIFCDENGHEVDGDKVLAICADHMIDREELSHNTVVTTVMSNIALERFINERGAQLIRTKVGDRYVVEEMKKRGCNFGGEKSGHIIFLDHTTTGDGTLASLKLLSIMKEKDKRLSELSKIIDLFPQILLNIKVKEKKPFEGIPLIHDLLNTQEKRLNGKGRINLRYSGTEPLARIMVEGENELLIKDIANEIANVLERNIGI